MCEKCTHPQPASYFAALDKSKPTAVICRYCNANPRDVKQHNGRNYCPFHNHHVNTFIGPATHSPLHQREELEIMVEKDWIAKQQALNPRELWEAAEKKRNAANLKFIKADHECNLAYQAYKAWVNKPTKPKVKNPEWIVASLPDTTGREMSPP